jgi:hypothetical protein
VRPSWRSIVVFAHLSGVLVGSCGGGPSQRRDAGTGDGSAGATGWGAHPSPPLDDLVRAAVAKAPPPVPRVPYATPAPVTVPSPPAVDVSWLPRDERGRPVLLNDGVLRYTVDVDKREPIFAMARCARMLSGCPQRADVTAGRSIDACWASVPTCATDQPWTESAPCCPARCPELYRTLRELGYGPLDANRHAVESMCFNGLRERLGRP